MNPAEDSDCAGNADPYLYDFIPVRMADAQEPTLLYGLEPIGIGTPLVESLSSYLVRLAAAHMLPVSALLRDVIAIRLPHSDHYLERPIGRQAIIKNMNGMGSSTSSVVDVVEELTGRTNLSDLTMLPFSKVLSPYRLVYSESYWCPYCFEEQRMKGVPVYFPLMWSLHGWCIVHRCSLVSVCPHCHYPLSVIGSRTVAGFCSHCQSWLGVEPKVKSEANGIDDDDFFVRFFNWRMSVDVNKYQPTFPSMLKYLIRKRMKKTDVASLARLLGIPELILREMLVGKRLPALVAVFSLSSTFKIDPMDILTISGAEMLYRDAVLLSSLDYSVLGPRMVDWSQLSGLLRDVANGKSSLMRLEDIARVYRCTLEEMTSRYPELCADVVKRINNPVKNTIKFKSCIVKNWPVYL